MEKIAQNRKDAQDDSEKTEAEEAAEQRAWEMEEKAERVALGRRHGVDLAERFSLSELCKALKKPEEGLKNSAKLCKYRI